MPLCRCLSASLLSLMMCAPAFADPLYAINFLPTGFAPAAINNAGQVVGTYEGAAAILAGGAITSLAAVAPDSYGLGINDRGAVAGAFASPWSGAAFTYDGGVLTRLGPLLGEIYPYSNAVALNDSGTVIGTGYPFAGEASRGYVYDGAAMRMIPTFGGDWSSAEAINASGAVVGTATLRPTESWLNSDRHAYVDRGGVMQDLGTLGGLRSEAYDINDAGLVAGWSETDVNPDGIALSRPFLYDGNGMRDLGTLGGAWGHARALNNLGLVVGDADILATEGWGAHAFLYIDGRMIDLNTLVSGAAGWEMVNAYDVNDAGQILGLACRQGDCVDVRLDLVPAVPEPGSWALLLAGLALLGWRGRARGKGQACARSGARHVVRKLSRHVSRHALRRAALPALALAGAAIAAAPALAQSSYDISFLPAGFEARSIDGAGRIAGRGFDAEGDARAFVWDAGAAALLPTLGGPSSFATAINGGMVAGASLSGDVTRGFLYAGGAIQAIGTLYGGDSYAYGLNAAGQVVGESSDAFGNSRAFLYSGGTLLDIGTLGGADARARAINGGGDIVGGSQPGAGFPDDGAHAFLYRAGHMTDLGTLGGGFSWANAINDAGQVAGYSLTTDNAAWHPFLFSGGVMRDLGSFGGGWGEAYGINGAGAVVGASSLPGGGFSHAFVYADGQLLDLNELVDGLGIFTLTSAVGINDRGQIAANGCDLYGYCAPVLLSPVPEPAAALLLLAGLPLVLRRRVLAGRARRRT